jgi:hypothetical protein
MATVHSPLSSGLIASNCSVLLIVFSQFFTGIALGDVDLSFSPIVMRKGNPIGGN